jgi:hypothetical protein
MDEAPKGMLFVCILYVNEFVFTPQHLVNQEINDEQPTECDSMPKPKKLKLTGLVPSHSYLCALIN